MKKFTLALVLATSTMFAHQITAKKAENNTYQAQFWAHREIIKNLKQRQHKGCN